MTTTTEKVDRGLRNLVAQRLRVAFHRAGRTQQEMSADLDIHVVAISKHCTGVHAPNIESLVRYCRYLQVSADWVLGLKDEAERPDSTEEFLERAAERARLAQLELQGAMAIAHGEGMSLRAIAEQVGSSHETVRRYVLDAAAEDNTYRPSDNIKHVNNAKRAARG